ncbi:MAG: PilN domain-containing protein [Deltaproteobacteria bacterium]|nr:PilN domain-containing protein [Deltaproteobacteria bacterium]
MTLVSWLLNQEGIPDNGLFLEIGGKSNTMVLYLNRRITLIRNHIYNGGATDASPDDQDRDLTDTQTAGQTESKLKSFCEMVQNTIHSFGWQTNKVIRPEKTFFTGIGSLDPVTGDLLNRFLDTPVERINLSKDKRVRMDYSIEQAWNPSLMDGALALALRDTKRGGGFNLRKDEFEIKKQYFGLKNEIRKVAAFLIIILLFLIVDLGVDYYFLNKRYRIANQRSTELFRQTFPDAKKIQGSAYDNMISKMKEQKKSAFLIPGIKADQRVLDLIKDISQRVPKSSDLHITSMVVDLETVRISGETDTFNTVDNIKSGLEPSEYFSAVTISSANLDRTGKRVKFEMKLQRTK